MSYDNPKLSEYKAFLNGKTASVIGVGISNIPLIEFLIKNNVKSQHVKIMVMVLIQMIKEI